MTQEHPDSAVIDRLEGSTAVAKLCRVRPQAVSQWRRNGIPSARRDYLQLLRPDAFSEATDQDEQKMPADEVRDAA